jgi:hypothetical protein
MIREFRSAVCRYTYEITQNIEVRNSVDRERLLNVAHAYETELADFSNRAKPCKGEKPTEAEQKEQMLRSERWGPFFRKNLTYNPDDAIGVRYWVPLTVLSRFLANPIASNTRTHPYLSDAKDGHCRWDGWLQNGALEPEDAALIDPDAEPSTTTPEVAEKNAKNFRRSRIAEYYLQQILLLAQLCVGRNTLCAPPRPLCISPCDKRSLVISPCFSLCISPALSSSLHFVLCSEQ